MALRCEDGRRREFTTPFGCRQGQMPVRSLCPRMVCTADVRPDWSECDRKPHGTSAHAIRSLTEVGFVSGERHEERVGLICGGAFDPCDGRSRYARRCENLKGEAAVSSDKAPGRHNLERSHEASIDAQLNWKNRRSDAVTLSASASVGWAKARSAVPTRPKKHIEWV